MLQLDETCIERHQGERQAKTAEVDEEALESAAAESESFDVLDEGDMESESGDSADKEHTTVSDHQADDSSSHHEVTEQSADQHSDDDEEENAFPDTDIHVSVTGDKLVEQPKLHTLLFYF
jgi:hypothetical protein